MRIDGGVIAQIGERLDTNEHRVVEAAGQTLVPAFVDPHVHLRTPGREDEETIASGTAAAAAGGYCAILAMPNTEPVVDDPETIRGLRTRAEIEAHIPVGFFAAITKGQAGEELAELGSLADAGAVGFTDDGRPVVAAGVMRRALQYNALTGRPIAVHCEEQTLTRGGHAHAGAVAAELGIGGWPSLGESLMVARDVDLAADTGQPVHLMHLSARESVDHLRRAHGAGVRASGEVTPHHLCLTDDAVRTLDPNKKMNPPLRSERRPHCAGRSLAGRDDRGGRHRPRAAFVRREGGAVRIGAVWRRRPRDGVLRALHLPRRAGRAHARDGARADVRRARCDLRPRPSPDRGRCAANLTLLDLAGSWRVRADRMRSRSQNSWLLGERLAGAVSA